MKNERKDIKNTNARVHIDRPSIAHALNLVPKLRECKKFELNDRVIFSRNLGSITAEILKEAHSLNIKKIFQEAFGSSAESMYKKRKSLITLPNENPRAGSLRSRARDYLEIIGAVAKFKAEVSEKSEDTLRQHLILRFVEGSSFDDQRNIGDRLYEESLTHLNTVLSKIVSRVLDEVDLDYQYIWCKNHIPHFTPSLEKIYQNYLTPRVRVLDVMMPVKMGSHAYFTVKKKELDEYRKNLDEGDVLTSIFIRHLVKNYSFISEDDLESYVRHGFEGDIESLLPKLDWSKEDEVFLIRSSVYLEMRFDEWSAKWVLVPVWKQIETNSVMSFEELGSYRGADLRYRADDYNNYFCSDGKHLRHAQEVDMLIDCDLRSTLISQAHSDDEEITYIIYEFDPWHDTVDFMDNEFRGIEFPIGFMDKQLTISDFGAFFMKTPEDNESINYHVFNNESIKYYVFNSVEFKESDIENQSFTMAPEGSLSDVVLNNLAYASQENRIDNLLVKHAKQQFSEFQSYEANCKKQYLNAIEGLDN